MNSVVLPEEGSVLFLGIYYGCTLPYEGDEEAELAAFLKIAEDCGLAFKTEELTEEEKEQCPHHFTVSATAQLVGYIFQTERSAAPLALELLRRLRARYAPRSARERNTL